MPLYHGDLEASEGVPKEAQEFSQLLLNHHGLLISSPEYNSSFSPLLKNTLDWASRPMAGKKNLMTFENKVAVIMSASPGNLGGIRGLVQLLTID